MHSVLLKKFESVHSKIFVQKGVLGHILRGNGALHYQLSLHGPPVYNLDDVNEVLRTLEAAYEFGMVGSTGYIETP